MKYLYSSFWIFAIAVLLSGCEEKQTIASKSYVFNKEFHLTAEKIKINQIFEPVNISKSDNYIIIQAKSGEGGNCFYVYTRDNFQFLYSFGKHGRGPDELLSPMIVRQAPGDMFLAYDNLTNKYFVYELTDQGVLLQKKLFITIQDRNKGLIQSIARVNDSIILFNTLSGMGNFLHPMNINTSTEIDVLTLRSGLEEQMKADYNPALDGYHIDCKDGLLVLGYNHIDEMVFTAIDSNYRFVDRDIALRNTTFTPEKSLLDNVFYYAWPHIGDKFVFTQRYGKTMQELQPLQLRRNFSFDVEVLSKQNEPVALLHFDQGLWRLLIDEDNHCIYSWDPRENFDFIHKYTFDL